MTSSQSQQALTKRSAADALMPPPPPPKRIKRPAVVLDEDTYTSSLSHIIARDFFPALLESDVQQEYLDAVESRDKEWIREVGAKLTQLMTPGPEGRRQRGRRGMSMTPLRGEAGGTPRQFGRETPTPRSQVGDEERPEADTNMSLSAFQAKYTSEDNESFNALLDKQNTKRAEKYSWLLNGNRLPSGRQIAWHERKQKLLQQQAAQEDLENKYGESDPGKQLIRRPVHPDDRPAMPNVKQSQPRNAFFFDPDSLEDVQQTVAQAAEEKSNAPLKAIAHDNTRLALPSAEAITAPSPSLSAIDAAIAGRPRATDTEPGYDGSETPRVNGYAFVDEEPTARELRREASHESDSDDERQEHLLQLLTEANGGDSTANPFKLSESSRRETLHHALVERTSKSKRAGGRLDALRAGQGADSGRTPTPKFLSATPRAASGALTPAAQRLLGKVGGTPVRGEVVGSVFGTGRKAEGRWTPRAVLTPRRES